MPLPVDADAERRRRSDRDTAGCRPDGPEGGEGPEAPVLGPQAAPLAP